jgi:hypothetical protein
LAPVLFGGGRRLFENLREPAPRLRIDKMLDSPAATHLLAIDVEGFRDWPSGEHPNGTGG